MNFKVTISFILIALLTFSSQNGYTEDKQRTYKLLGTAPKGSNMRPVEARSPIPFNKRFDQLSERQMAIYRADFDGLKDTDTPPFPKKGLKEIYIPLIKGHKRIGGSGDLLAYAEINEKGGVNKVTVYMSPSKKLADLTTTVLFNTKFRPPSCNGDPCIMDYPFYYQVPHRNRELRSLDKEDFGRTDIDTAPNR